MASDNHYNYRDLIAHLRQLKDDANADMLEAYNKKVDRILNERSKAADDVLNLRREAITPLLRPCHKRKAATLT